MKTSRVQEAIEILKASVDDSPVKGKSVPKPEPRNSKKVSTQSKKVRKS
jgi:hypothetical protein